MRENGKIEDSLDVYESQILRLAAVGGARRHQDHGRFSEPAGTHTGGCKCAWACRSTDEDVLCESGGGVCQDAMLRRQGWEGTWGRQRRDSGFTDGNI